MSHVQKKIAAATRVLHTVNRLQNFEWDLSAKTERQLYISCITSISDYESEIWYINQKTYLNQLQKLQNTALRKILECFRTTSVNAMKIEVNISSVKLRLTRKSMKYALRVIKMKKNHSVRSRTSTTYFSEYQNSVDEENSKFAEWNVSDKHSTQLIRTLHSIVFIVQEINVEQSLNSTKLWIEIDDQIDYQILDKELTIKHHQNNLRRIFQNIDTSVYYIDEFKTVTSAASTTVLYLRNNTISRVWNLENTVNELNTKSYAINQALINSLTFRTKFNHVWIFTDSQKFIKKIQSISNQWLY